MRSLKTPQIKTSPPTPKLDIRSIASSQKSMRHLSFVCLHAIDIEIRVTSRPRYNFHRRFLIAFSFHSQVLQALRDSTADPKRGDEHHNVPDDPSLREGAAQQQHHAGTRARLLR
jgi:hypothetical protein